MSKNREGSLGLNRNLFNNQHQRSWQDAVKGIQEDLQRENNFEHSPNLQSVVGVFI